MQPPLSPRQALGILAAVLAFVLATGADDNLPQALATLACLLTSLGCLRERTLQQTK